MQNWFHKTFRILNWGPAYNRQKLWGDVKAGLTTGSMLIAQGMADALIVGVPPIYGLYAGAFPLLIYPLMGTSRHLSLGPVTVDSLVISAGVSLLAASNTTEYIMLVILLTMLTGLLEILLGTLRLGVVLKVFSRPVVAGFITAAPIIIGFSQLGHLLGLQLPNSQHITVIVVSFWHHLNAIHGPTIIWGLIALGLLLFFKYFRPHWPGAVIVLCVGIFVAWLISNQHTGIQIVGSIPHGLPGFSVPKISWLKFRNLLPTAFTLALVEFMSVASLGKAFAKRHNYRVDTNHELVALGSSNFFGSFFNALPVSASFSRSSAAELAGGTTALANWITALVIIITLLFLTGVFYFIPITVLAAIIIVAVSGLVDFPEIWRIFTIKKTDGAIAIFTFLCTLFIGIQQGILLGIGASILVLVYEYYRYSVTKLGIGSKSNIMHVMNQTETASHEKILILRVDISLLFFNAEFFQDAVAKKIDEQHQPVKTIILDAVPINIIDTTGTNALKSTINTLQKKNIELYITGLNNRVLSVLESAGLHEWLGGQYLKKSVAEAIACVREKSGLPPSDSRPEIPNKM